jgi:hypothetical protein
VNEVVFDDDEELVEEELEVVTELVEEELEDITEVVEEELVADELDEVVKIDVVGVDEVLDVD